MNIFPSLRKFAFEWAPHFASNDFQFIINNNTLFIKLIAMMLKGSAIHSQRNIGFQTGQNDRGWDETFPLQQKNHNTTHAMNSTVYKSLSKKNEINKKKFNLKILKMQGGEVLGQTCLSFFKKESRVRDKQNYEAEASKGSNFQILKKQIQYLEQNDFDNEKFPNYSPPLSKNESLCFTGHLKNSTDANLFSKPKILSTQPLNGNFQSTSKRVALFRDRPGTSENKQAKKYFSNNKKSARKNAIEIHENEEVIHTKNHNKFELIAPFRKYFQSKRHRQNRSCTLKIDELYGKKLNKLAHFTLEST